MKYLLSTCALSLLFFNVAYPEEPSGSVEAGGCRLWGRVVAPYATVPSRLKVEVDGQKPAPHQKAQTADGTFTFKPVPGGLYRFRVFEESGQLLVTQSETIQGDHDYVVIALPTQRPRSNIVSASLLGHRTPAAATTALNRGLKAAESGDVAKSIELFQKARDIDPYYTESEIDLAIQYNKLKEADKALEHARLAYALEPDYPGAWHTLATLLLVNGSYHDAEVVLRAALKRASNIAGLHGMLAAALMEQRLSDEAMAQLKLAIDGCPQARLWVSRALVHNGMMTQALDMIREYMRVAASACERQDLQSWMDQISATAHR
jgi:tetratricopeptide (TPR) repeat protein